jgi:hypothetical protein
MVAKIGEYNEHYLFREKNIKFLVKNGISLAIFPNIKLTINGLEAENIQYRETLLHMNIKKIEVGLNLANFLNKTLKTNDISISGVSLMVEKNQLQDFYMKKEIVKKIVKLADNEVVSVKDKLKNLLMGGEGNHVEEGYREIEIEDDIRYDLDNTEVEKMLLSLLKIMKIGSFSFDKDMNVDFSGMTMSIVNDGDIQKEFKNISGTVKTTNFMREMKLKSNFTLNNIDGILDIKTKNDETKFVTQIKLTNSLNDKINIKYDGNDLLQNTISDVSGNFDVSIDSGSFNDFVQWILPTNSKYYYRFDYKRGFKFSANVGKNKNEFNIENIKVDAKDVNIEGSVNLLEDKNILKLTVNELNFDEFIVNLVKSKNTTTQSEILVFKVNSLEDLIREIQYNDENSEKSKNAEVYLNIKHMLKGGKNVKESVVNFDIIDNSYKINDARIAFDNFEISTSNQQSMGDFYYNDLTIKGTSFKEVVDLLNFGNILTVNDFELTSKIFVYNETIYLCDYEINNNDQKIEGFLEYSFDEENSYIASKIRLNTLKFNMENKKSKTLKEKLLWLNNFSGNVFLDLEIENLSLNSFSDIYFRSKINYFPGYINFYDVERIRANNIGEIRGNVLFDIRKKNPVININLIANDITYDFDLIDYVFDLEKYKHILFRSEINADKQAKYWINKLFTFPIWEEINGNINLQAQNILLNGISLNNMKFDSAIEDGLVSLHDLAFTGLGGSTRIRGKVDLKTTRSIHLVLTDTIYNIEDIYKLFFKQDSDVIKGTIGIGGIIKGTGFNEAVFASSLSLQTKFVGKNLFIKQLGLGELSEKLSKIYSDSSLLDTIRPNDIILNGTGTTFDDFSGSLTAGGRVTNMTVDAKGGNISNKLISKVDSSSKDITINIINTSAIINKVGGSAIPLYVVISFKEDFSNKANLTINASQINEYIGKVRRNIGK